MSGRLSGVLLVLALAAGALGGCTSTEDVLGTATIGIDGATVAKTGTYPRLGGPLEVANEQLSDAEAAQMGSELEALAQSRQLGSTSDAAYRKRSAELRKLAKEHGRVAAEEIEN